MVKTCNRYCGQHTTLMVFSCTAPADALFAVPMLVQTEHSQTQPVGE